MEDCSLRFVETVDEAAELMRWLSERRPLLGMDTETTGLKLYAGDKMRLFQVGDARTGWAVDLFKWRGLIEEVLRKAEGPVVFANAPFDLAALEQAGLPAPAFHRAHDTVIMSRLLNPNMRAGLKEVGERYFPGSSAGEHVLNDAKRAGKWTWATIPTDCPAYWAYSAFDPVLACRIAEPMWAQVNAEGYRTAYDREMAVAGILFRAVRRGIRIDPGYASQLKAEWENEMAVLLGELQAMGLENPNSGRQIAAAMQITENWDPDDFTETGQPKVDEAVLKGIDSEISRRVLRFKRLKKWTGTYLNTFLRDRDATDHLHISINTLLARTGRMSAGILMTLPRGKVIRNAVIPSEGGRLVSIDWDNQEGRIFAHFAQDPTMLARLRAGEDFHTAAARVVFGDQTISKGDPRRQIAKACQLGLLYGAGAAKIAETAGVPVEQARAFLSTYMDTFPGVRVFMDGVGSVAQDRLEQTGEAYVNTWGGRRLPLDADRLYSGVNYVCQGSAADLIKTKIIELDAAGLGDDIIAPVHDELIFDFPADEVEDRSREAAAIMTEDRAFSVQLPVSVSLPVERWGLAK